MGSDTANRNRNTWAALASRLAPVCVAIASLMAFTYLAMNKWRHGVTVESWTKVTARVIDRRQVKVSRADGTGDDYRIEIDVSYNINGTVHKKTFGRLITDSTIEIYVNPRMPWQASLGFDRAWFLTYVLFAIASLIAVLMLGTLAFYPHLASKDHRYENSW